VIAGNVCFQAAAGLIATAETGAKQSFEMGGQERIGTDYLSL
jgi:hypothetical protein